MLAVFYYLLVFVFFESAFYIASKYKTKDWLIVLLMLVASCMLGFRYIRTDWISYMLQYKSILTINVFRYDEFLWMESMKLFAKLGMHYVVYFTFIFFLQFILILYGCRKLYKIALPYIGFFSFFTLLSFYSNGMRQAVAISLFIFAYQYIVEKKLIHYCIIMIIAYFFHASSIFYFLSFFIVRYMNFKSIPLQIVFFLSSVYVFPYFAEKIPNYIYLMNIFGDYGWQIDHWEFESRTDSTGIAKTLDVVIFLIIIVFSNNIKRKSKGVELMYSLMYICTCLSFSFAYVGSGARLFFYGKFLDVVYCGILVLYLKVNKQYEIISYVIMAITVTVFSYHLFQDFYPGLTPLNFFWEENKINPMKYVL